MKDGVFYCAVAAKRIEGRGRILLYKSDDLFRWQFAGDLFGVDSKGVMIECPDYNEELGYLLHCEQFQPSENGLHLNIHTCRSTVGRIDYSSGSFVGDNSGIVDYGFDMYAPQTFAYSDVLVGWLNMWDRNVPSEKYGFAGMLTVPRRVSVADGRLYQEPIVNIGETKVKDVSGFLADNVKIGVITIDATGLEALELRTRVGGDNYTELTLGDGEWVFDRSRSGEAIIGAEKDSDSLSGIRRMPYSGKENVTLTVVLDEFSIEIFEDGRALSSTVYPPETADGLTLKVKAKSCTYRHSVVCLKR